MEHLMVEPELKEKILRQEPHKFVTLHRSSPQMTTGVTLLSLMCGRKLKWKLFYDAKTMFVLVLCP